jgi:hypothetical protein
MIAGGDVVCIALLLCVFCSPSFEISWNWGLYVGVCIFQYIYFSASTLLLMVSFYVLHYIRCVRC